MCLFTSTDNVLNAKDQLASCGRHRWVFQQSLNSNQALRLTSSSVSRQSDTKVLLCCVLGEFLQCVCISILHSIMLTWKKNLMEEVLLNRAHGIHQKLCAHTL